MVALDAANWEFIEVDIAELINAFNLSWFVKFSVFIIPCCVPLLADCLICCHILHKLVVHGSSKARQHAEESEGVDRRKYIDDLHALHEVGKLFFIINLYFFRLFFVFFREDAVEFVYGYDEKVDKPKDEGYKTMKRC